MHQTKKTKSAAVIVTIAVALDDLFLVVVFCGMRANNADKKQAR